MVFEIDRERYSVLLFWYEDVSKHNFSSIYDYLKFKKIVFESNSPVLISTHHLVGEFKHGANSNMLNVVIVPAIKNIVKWWYIQSAVCS